MNASCFVYYHRSHFGSRYTCGCCDIASLFWYFFTLLSVAIAKQVVRTCANRCTNDTFPLRNLHQNCNPSTDFVILQQIHTHSTDSVLVRCFSWLVNGFRAFAVGQRAWSLAAQQQAALAICLALGEIAASSCFIDDAMLRPSLYDASLTDGVNNAK